MSFEIDFYTQSNQAIIQLANAKLLGVTDDWEKQIWQFIADWFNPAITSIQVSTSGSTGAPKQIVHTKTAMLYSAGLTCAALNLDAGNTALLCLPVNKISGIMMVVRSIHHKMKLVCIKPSTRPLHDLPNDKHIDFAAFTPMQFNEVTSEYAAFKKADEITNIILGGEDVQPELLEHIKILESKIHITFGMTETISHMALKRLNGLKPDENFKVFNGVNISIDERSCLVIDAPLLGQPHLVTNDVVSLVNKNEFKWLGRADNVINTGGIKIQPEEIERQLTPYIKVPFFIASVPDKLTGEKVVLVLESNQLTTEAHILLNDGLKKLEKLHSPKQLLLISHFTRTPNGKIKRKESVVDVAGYISL